MIVKNCVVKNYPKEAGEFFQHLGNFFQFKYFLTDKFHLVILTSCDSRPEGLFLR